MNFTYQVSRILVNINYKEKITWGKKRKMMIVDKLDKHYFS